MASFLVGDAGRLPFRDGTFDLVFGSPPYVDARLYLEDGRDLGIARECEAWVRWMLAVTAEAQRVCRGPVLWVASGVTRDRNYQPACEGLMWEWWKRGGECHQYRPCYWHRSGIPGSGGDNWFRADVEYVMCFKRPGGLPWSDNTAMGHPPRWAPGGDMSHRLVNGTRKDKIIRAFRGEADGTVKGGHDRDICRIANPGNLVRAKVGGGLLGHPLAHENEAPFPVDLAEHFVRSCCPPGGLCLDPFSGSGTTAEAAEMHGRRAVGLDLRMSQCRLGRRRIERPHAHVVKASRPDGPMPLFEPPAVDVTAGASRTE